MHRDSCSSLVRLLSSQASLSPAHTSLLLSTLSSTITDSQTPTNLEHSKLRLKHLYRVRRVGEARVAAAAMAATWPEAVYPREWLCKLLLETCSGALEGEVQGEEEVVEAAAVLLQLSPSSPLGPLAAGAVHLVAGRRVEALVDLRRGTELAAASPNIHGLLLLARALRGEAEWRGVEEAARAAKGLLGRLKEEARGRVGEEVHLLILEALYWQGGEEKLGEAGALVKEQGVEGSKEWRKIVARVLASLGREEAVAELLEEVGDERGLVEGLLAAALGRVEAGRALLEDRLAATPECPAALVALGLLLWPCDRPAAVALLLRAARAGPTLPLPFLHLGHHYASLGEGGRDKARRCYARALHLRPGCEEAGRALSDLYRALGRWEDNLALLTSLQGAGGGWASLRLGLHHLATGAPQQAVAALQAALRAAPASLPTWEALADAYLARGSYSAARKAFARVLEMRPGAEYPRLMIAGIRMRTGEFKEAVEEYQGVQASHPSSLPALRGEGEAQVAWGRACLDSYLDRNVVTCVGAALPPLAEAMALRPGLAGTWRLLGEAAALVTLLPAQVVGEVAVPACLMHEGGEGQVVVGREELLQLASRSYSRCLQLAPGSAGVWHELGRLYSALGEQERAVAALRQAVTLAPGTGGLWAALGAEHGRAGEWALAQHCLVRSLKLETSAVAWTNLGAVYLALGHPHLANSAFKEAQAAEPDYVRGWAGQVGGP